jgi:orotidine-5'-phosphate decarboxylase
MAAPDRLIVALDYPSRLEALDLVDRLEGSVRWLKVGLQLYLAGGNALVTELRELGFGVFLDLKLHDIPNTVAGAVRSAGDSGANLLTVHAAGGPAMLHAAAEAAGTLSHPPRLLAVTVLTSMDDAQLGATGVADSPLRQAVRLGELSARSGIGGLVCSPDEILPLRSSVAQDSFLVVPGIRPEGATGDDQRRTSSAREAIRRGADMLVVGRPITRAAEPALAAEILLEEITAAEQS